MSSLGDWGALALENGRRRKKGRKSKSRSAKSRVKSKTRSARSRAAKPRRRARTRKVAAGKWKFGQGIRTSRAKGAKLISTARKQGRPAYVVKGVKGWFAKFTSAKKAANKKAYGARGASKARRSSTRRRARR